MMEALRIPEKEWKKEEEWVPTFLRPNGTALEILFLVLL